MARAISPFVFQVAERAMPNEAVNTPEALPARNSASSARDASTADEGVRRLTHAIARGNEEAFQELYDRYHGRLVRLALGLSRGDGILASEVAHNTLLTAANKLPPLASEAHLWNWLARVARQHLSKAWRKQRRESALVSMAEVPENSPLPEPEAEMEASLDTAMNELEADDRQTVEWFYYDGLSHKDIADRLGATPKAVSSRLERLRLKLRAFIFKNLSHET